MSRKANKNKSTKGKVTFKVLVVVPFCVVLITQGIICAGVLDRSQTLPQMRSDAYSLFSERISSRAGYLQNDMTLRWAGLGSFPDKVSMRVNEVLTAQGASAQDVSTGSDLAISLIDAASEEIFLFIQRIEVNGVYLVLVDNQANASEESRHSALYVRDANPTLEVANASDLLLAACPVSVSRRLDVALDSQWSTTFPLAAEGQEKSNFFYRPLRAAQAYPDANPSDLGYWGYPVDLGWSGTESITYSKPVKDAAGKVVAILGVEVSSDRIASYFPYRDLGDSQNGSYVLAVTDESGGQIRSDGVAPRATEARTYTVLETSGASQSLYVEEGAFSASVNAEGLMVVDAPSGSSVQGQAIASASEIKLYDSTSPFASEHWALVGLQSEKDLFLASRELSDNLAKVFWLSVIFGVILAVVTAWASSSRLRHLMKEVRAAKPEEPISFTPTGIVEVDELAEAVESLGAEVAASASRLSQTLKLSNRAIAAFEYSKETKIISYTDGLRATLRLILPDEACAVAKVGGTMSVAAFDALFDDVRPFFVEEAENRWLVSDLAGRRWLRVVVVENEDNIRVLGVIEDATDEIVTRLRIEHERDHDVLTGLMNRRAFEQGVTDQLKKNPPVLAAMLMFDLDNLKYINDTYGHDWGDQYIRAAAQVVDEVFEGEGIYARVSGDEFLVFVRDCANIEDIRKLFDLFMASLGRRILETPDGALIKVRASAGIALYPEDATDFERLREFADFAMYEAKNNRKGELVEFNKENHEKRSYILSSKEDLNRLLDDNLIDYHFQPIVEVRSAEVMAYEALMRPRLASISTPDRVLALARSQSKLYRVEQLTFFGAISAFSRSKLSEEAVLFVNSIATQCLSPGDEAELQQRYGPLLERLVIEITESDYSREMSLHKERLAQKWCARLAVDDFGSGYSSESTLLEYQADFVKIDMGIVRNIDCVKDQQDIAKNLIEYAHNRNIGVVAEGVETEEELRTLIGMNIDFIQGYLVGKPAPEPQDITDEAKALMRRLVNESQ